MLISSSHSNDGHLNRSQRAVEIESSLLASREPWACRMGTTNNRQTSTNGDDDVNSDGKIRSLYLVYVLVGFD